MAYQCWMSALFNSVAFWVGTAVILYTGFRIVSFLKKFFGGASIDLTKLGAKKGGWAVVTGSTDGIGKAYAVELAKRGFNIFLISRTQSKLDTVAEEIAKAHNVETKTLAVDFVQADNETFRTIEAALQKISVGVLVNNVGINYEFPERFLDTDQKLNKDIVHVNVNGTIEMTRIVLSQMVEKRAGAIINLSSMSGIVPSPMLSVYSASKAFIDFFSKCLAAEYKSQNIFVQSVTPGMVVSNMSKIRRASLTVCKPEVIASKSINRLGKDIELSPYYIHEIMNFVLGKVLPLSVSLKKILDIHVDIRARALKKRAASK